MEKPSELTADTTVYIIHFERPFWHAQHYIGYTANLPRRIEQHRNGTGAKLLRAITRRGIPWEVVRTWPGGPAFERALKNRKKSRDLCPVCIQQQLCTRWHLKPLDLEPVAQLWEVSHEAAF
jgi:predicted GIY-YIG superfamily endonuclease